MWCVLPWKRLPTLTGSKNNRNDPPLSTKNFQSKPENGTESTYPYTFLKYLLLPISSTLPIWPDFFFFLPLGFFFSLPPVPGTLLLHLPPFSLPGSTLPCPFWLTRSSLPWRRKWQPTPVFLPGESQGREPGGLPSMGSHRVSWTWLTWRDSAAAFPREVIHDLLLRGGSGCHTTPITSQVSV